MRAALLCFIVLLSSFLKSYAGNDILEKYAVQMKKVMSNCLIDYEMTCVYPDGEKLDVRGRMGTQGSNYYDSSNVRFVFKNDEWYLMAEHESKLISVLYLPGVNSELGNMGSVNVSSYLYGEDFFTNIKELKILKQNTDTAWIRIIMKEGSMLENLEMVLLRKDFTPIAYNVSLKYSMPGYYANEVDATDQYISVKLKCKNVQHPVPVTLFDSYRLIEQSGKKASLRKFKNYKTYISNPKSN